MAKRPVGWRPPAQLQDDQALIVSLDPLGIHIRAGSEADLSAIIAVDQAASELFRHTGLLSDEALADHVGDDGGREALAENRLDVATLPSSELVGFVLYVPKGSDLYFQQVSVDPRHGRKGIGRRLLEHVDAKADQLGHTAVTLSTFRDLAWNAPFYSKLGYEILPRKKLVPYMLEIETMQAPFMDISKRVFMRKPIRKNGIRVK